jgi:ketosteroid isomerase-like protein
MPRHVTARSRSHRVLLRYMDILNSGNPEGLEEVLDPDYVQVIPQSREVVRGIENWAQIIRNWPPSEDRHHPQVLGSRVVPPEEHDVATPAAGFFARSTVISIEGEGDTLTTYQRTRYTDGSEWYIIFISTLRNGKIAKDIMFFGPMFEAPEWRSRWTDVMSPDGDSELLGLMTD